MEHKLERIRSKLKERRAMKLLSLAINGVLAAVAFAMMMTLGRDDMKIFLPSLIALVLLLVRLWRILHDRGARIFGKEFEGTIVKKQEKSEIYDSKITGSYGSFSDPRPYEHGRVRVIVSTVYARTDSGEVVPIGKFNEDQTSYLEVGDEIVVPKYGRYPVILNEKESRQKWLCPICGTVSPDGIGCGTCGFDYIP